CPMALGKASRIWITILFTVVVLILAADIGAKIYFTSDRLKALVIPPIEEATHRSVTIDDISISVFPGIAISIDNLRISNPPGTSFDRNDFVSLKNLKLNLKILPLFRKRME